MSTRSYRFEVALSFPGERRRFVEEVAEHLSKALGRDRVLYDRYYEAELARPDLDTYLQRLYHDQSELIAVFLCAEYEAKEWCGLEWRAIRDLIKKRRIESVMPFRFDRTEIPGLFSIDGYVTIGGRPSAEIAGLILERLKLNAREPLPASPVAPSSRKPVSLPYPSLGNLFRGREEALHELEESLRRAGEGEATAIVGKALHGLGGVGKTRLAVEYAWRHLADHSAVLFVPADTPESLLRNVAALSDPLVLDLPEHQAAEEETRVVAVLRWLRGHPGWLLILDNVDSREAARAAEELLRRLSGGQVLLTSRLSEWGPHVEAHELGLLSEEEATGLLLARTEPRRRKTPNDEAHARTLAGELGYLALALEQAAAYMRHHRLTFAGYLEAWQVQRDKVLEWYDEGDSSYGRSVAVTWQTSVDQLPAPARRLLERLAWLAPYPIPESLLDTEVPGAEPFDARDALAELDAYSLVTRAGETPIFTVHRLVQDVTRRSQQGDSAPEALVEALAWLEAGFVGNPQDVRAWSTLAPLALHVQTAVRHGDEASIAQPTSGLMDRLGRLLQNEARLGEAEPLMRRALAIDEASFGPDHPTVATDLNNLATLLQATNRLGEAEPLMRRALAIDEASFGPDHPTVAIDLNNLAQLLQATNRLGEAEPLMRRALAIDEASFGPDHPTVARDLNNLATLLQATNRLGEAEPLMRRALAIDEASFGPDHPKVAIRLNNLAQLLQDTNRLGEAEPLMRRALAVDEASFGPDHPTVARDLNNLATLLWATNRLGEAEPLMRRSLEIFIEFTRRTGHQHPHLEVVSGNYSQLLREQGRSEDETQAVLDAMKERLGRKD